MLKEDQFLFFEVPLCSFELQEEGEGVISEAQLAEEAKRAGEEDEKGENRGARCRL